MGNFQKFLFETSFDSDKIREAKARAAAEAEAAAAPPPPTFSEEELAAARESAFEEGRAAGLAEVDRNETKRLADLVGSLPAQFERLAATIEELEVERRRGALDAAVTVVRKLFPKLAQIGGLEEIRAVVDSCLERLRDEPRLVIRSADQDLDALRAHIESSAAGAGFEGKLVFLADETIAPGDVRVEWADGGAERDVAGLWREIDTIVERALAPSAEVGAAPERQKESSASHGARNRPQPQPAPQPAEVEPLRRVQSA